MATMKDIANRVGVSLTTVSNVVHGNYERVSPQTVQKILDAIQELHYVPNMSARALVSHSSRIIAFVDTHSPQETYAGNGFAGVLLSGLEGVVTDHGYFLMMRRGTDEDVLRLMLNNWNPDGVIFKDRVPQSLVDFVKKQGKPCVTINTYLEDPTLIQVRAEDRKGGYLAAQHLLSLGHRDILFIGAVHRGFMNNDQRYMATATRCAKRASRHDRIFSSTTFTPSTQNEALRWGVSSPRGRILPASVSAATNMPPPLWQVCAKAAHAFRKMFPSSGLTMWILRA